MPLLESIFKLKLVPKFRSGGKNGCYCIQTSKKDITSFFQEYGFKPGRKTDTVTIPSYIKEAGLSKRLAFVRGYFDTDGCLRFDNLNGQPHRYPKVEFASVSHAMIRDLSELLTDMNFRNYIWSDRNSLKLCVAGNTMLHKWVAEVQPKNSKHLNKYQLFRKQGFVPSNAAVA